MSLLPRSLLGRNALLIVVLIVIGQLGSALLLRQMVIRPRVEQAADSVARTVQAMREGLTALPVAERQRFVDRFNQRSGSDGGGEGRDMRDRVLLTPMERNFVRAVSARIAGSGTEAVWRFDGNRGLAVRMTIDGTAYWISLPGALPAREFTGAWLAVTAVSALLAVIGALWFQRRLNRPLARVVNAAGVLAGGQVPAPLPERGPTEIATVSRSFNHLVASLQQAERERTGGERQHGPQHRGDGRHRRPVPGLRAQRGRRATGAHLARRDGARRGREQCGPRPRRRPRPG